MFTAVAEVSQVAEARRLVGDLARRIGLPPAPHRPGGDRRHRAGHQHSEARRRRTYPRRQMRRCRGHRAGTAGARSRQRHGRSGSLHGGRLLDRRQPRHRASAPSNASPTRVRIYTRPGQGCAIMARFVERPAAQAPGRCWAPRWRPIRANRCAATTGRGATPLTVARSCWSTARATASRRRARRRPPCGRFRTNAAAAMRGRSSSGCIARWRRPAAARWRSRASIPRRAWFASSGSAISARCWSDAGKSRHMVSHNGTAGHVAPRIREFTYDFTSESAGHSALRRVDHPLGFCRLSGARRTAPVAGRRRAAARSPARP